MKGESMTKCEMAERIQQLELENFFLRAALPKQQLQFSGASSTAPLTINGLPVCPGCGMVYNPTCTHYCVPNTTAGIYQTH